MATGNNQPIIPAYLEDAGYVQSAAGNIDAVKTFTQLVTTIPAGIILVVFRCEAQSVRWRADGTNPTTTVGNLLLVSDVLTYPYSLTALSFIAATAGAILNIQMYRTRNAAGF